MQICVWRVITSGICWCDVNFCIDLEASSPFYSLGAFGQAMFSDYSFCPRFVPSVTITASLPKLKLPFSFPVSWCSLFPTMWALNKKKIVCFPLETPGIDLLPELRQFRPNDAFALEETTCCFYITTGFSWFWKQLEWYFVSFQNRSSASRLHFKSLKSEFNLPIFLIIFLKLFL